MSATVTFAGQPRAEAPELQNRRQNNMPFVAAALWSTAESRATRGSV